MPVETVVVQHYSVRNRSDCEPEVKRIADKNVSSRVEIFHNPGRVAGQQQALYTAGIAQATSVLPSEKTKVCA
jgi:hypothetical protein